MDRNRRERENNDNFWWNVGAAVTGLAAVAGGLYWLSQSGSSEEAQEQSSQGSEQPRRRRSTETERQHSSSVSSYLSGMLDRIDLNSEVCKRGLPRPSENPVINNLDSLLADVYVRYIALRSDDFELHYKVFDTIFQRLHKNMKDEDPYYRRYSSTVQIAGSHFDRLRIKKPNEFDIDIIIGLPLNLRPDPIDPYKSDIVLETLSAGYVQLKMGEQFQKFPFRDDWDINKTLFKWKDDNFYLLRSKFSDWFKSLVYRGLNKFEGYENRKMYYVEGVPYILRTSEAGPAMTLKIENRSRGFTMDVDLVPALKFFEDRWPEETGYRAVPPEYSHEIFMVVPKPVKAAGAPNDASRSWRMSLIYQENKMLRGTYNLRQIIRYLKKLRDAQDMCHIASYYVKTLFLWEVSQRNDVNFWRQSPAKLFILMVKRFHAALDCGNIPYYWNSNHNLIQGVNRHIIVGYAAKLKKLIQILDNPSDYVKVANYLLSPSEWEEYQKILRKVGVL